MFQISELHVLPSENKSSPEQESEDSLSSSPLAFIGTLKERDNPEARKNVAAMLLREDFLSVGCPFPVEVRTCLHTTDLPCTGGALIVELALQRFISSFHSSTLRILNWSFFHARECNNYVDLVRKV